MKAAEGQFFFARILFGNTCDIVSQVKVCEAEKCKKRGEAVERGKEICGRERVKVNWRRRKCEVWRG